MTKNNKIRVAIYSRNDFTGLNDTQDDIAFLQEYSTAHNMRVVTVRADTYEGGFTSAQPALRALVADAAETPRPYDMILVSDVMRFANSMSHLLDLLHELDRFSVGFVSLGRSLTTPARLEMSYRSYRTFELTGKGHGASSKAH